MFVTWAYAQEAGGDSHGEAPADDAHGAPADGHTEAGDGHGEGTFPPFDPASFPSQLLWLAITFGLFYLFLKKVVLPKIGGILEVRRDRIMQDLDQAARMKEEADAAMAAYAQELAEARQKANAIGNEARDGAKAEAEAERKQVSAALDKRLHEAEVRIASIKATAMKEVDAIADETAATIVEELLGKVGIAPVAAAMAAGRGTMETAAAPLTSGGTGRVQPSQARAATPAYSDSASEADTEVGKSAPAESAAVKPSLDSPDRPKGIEKPAAADDLKLISGIGPKIEGTLHSLGIFTFAQVAAWTGAERAWVDGYLNFKGRIDRDNWVKQADALARGGVEEYVRVFGKQPR